MRLPDQGINTQTLQNNALQIRIMVYQASIVSFENLKKQNVLITDYKFYAVVKGLLA